MKNKYLLLSCLLALSKSAMGQDIICVHGNDLCQAFDVNNIDSVTIGNDAVLLGTERAISQSDIDSVTFTRPTGAFVRSGWWGDVCGGHSTYNQQLDDEAIPLMEMTAADGICKTACYYLPSLDTALSRNPRKVGRKWRYVRNTLTGRRKLQLAVYDEQVLRNFTTPDCDGDSSYTRLDLNPWFAGRKACDVKRMVSYWHHPTEAALIPSHPVIGNCQVNDYSKVSTYNTVTFQDSVRCQILFWVYKDEVNCDTMHLFFHSNEEARAQFEQMDTSQDEHTQFELWENQIIITEHFQATIDEVMRWLTRFDFEMAQPIILRKE
jgi:hypothetical protein